MKPSSPEPKPDDQPDIARPKHLPLITTPRAEPPAIVPARMLNEAMYCERLMYLEGVQGEFTDNHFTVDGRNVHNRADSPGGKRPFPPASESDEAGDELEERPYEARSVWLTSERLRGEGNS